MLVMPISKSFFFIFIFHIIRCSAAYAPYFDSIYQSGDSLSDTGNFIRENPTPTFSCSNLPYGQDVDFSDKPTGRCSNGLLIVDFFAKALKLPFLNPYLDQGADFGHGVNFAVAGSTAMDPADLARMNVTTSTSTNSSLNVQLGWFRAHLTSFCSSTDVVDDECKKNRLKKALILMGEVGGNDYNYPLAEGKPVEDVYTLVPHVVSTIKDAVQEVIDLGAIQVVVPGNFPTGCLPICLFMNPSNDSSVYDDLKCVNKLNEFAVFHNNLLQQTLAELRTKNPGVGIFYGDYYCAFRWLLRNAASLGFEEDGVFKACCGKGDNAYNLDMNEQCGEGGVPVCEEPAKRLSWDGMHLTQEAYKHIADWLLSNMFTVSSSPSCVSWQGDNVISMVGKAYTTTSY